MRKGPITTLAVALMLPVSLSGCGTPDTGDASSAQGRIGDYTAPNPTVDELDEDAETANACDGAALSANVTERPGEGKAVLALKNTGAVSCVVTGWVQASFLDQAGTPIGLLAQHVEQPGPAEAVLVDPGQAAYAGLKWQQCQAGDSGCSSVATLMITTPGGDGLLQAGLTAASQTLDMRAAEVGTLQPSSDDVTAW